MSFEFCCVRCGSYTIFKDLECDPKYRCCANCEKKFHLEKDLVRFDRTDKDKVGRLMPLEESMETRLKVLSEAVQELATKVETILLGLEDLSEEETDFDLDQTN